MAKAPDKRIKPKDLANKSDAEVAERLFGKDLKEELDRVAHAALKMKD